MLSATNYAHNYAGIIGKALVQTVASRLWVLACKGPEMHCVYAPQTKSSAVVRATVASVLSRKSHHTSSPDTLN